ncbi:MAG: hypothetical protein ACK5NT_06525 [Pyrinomonadaceae bacterium]
MPKLIQKQVKANLNAYAEIRHQLSTLNAERDEKIKPLQARYEKAVAKCEQEFAENISALEEKAATLETEIKNQMQLGFDPATNEYSVRSIETDSAKVEVSTKSRRTIDAEKWLTKIPKSRQTHEFWETVNVLIGKADKFDSAAVSTLATESVNHAVNVKLK